MINPTNDSQSGLYQTSFKAFTKVNNKDYTMTQRIFVKVLTTDGKMNISNINAEKTVNNTVKTGNKSNFTAKRNETNENKTENLVNYYKDQ